MLNTNTKIMETKYPLPNNRTLIVDNDDFSNSPRDDDNMSRIIFFGNHRHFGDAHNVDNSNCNSWNDVYQEISKYFGRKDIAFIMPIYGYSHSGLTISTTPFSCPWDSGQLGFAVMLKSAIRENWSIKRINKYYQSEAIGIVEGEVRTLDTYISGEVYCFTIENEDGEVEDSCGGFYGEDINDNGMLEHISEEDKSFLAKSLVN